MEILFHREIVNGILQAKKLEGSHLQRVIKGWTFSEAQCIISVLELACVVRQNPIFQDSPISIIRSVADLKHPELLRLGEATRNRQPYLSK